MSRSLTVLAVGNDSPAPPDCVDVRLRRELFDRFGMARGNEDVRATDAGRWRGGRELRMRLTERFVGGVVRRPRPLPAGIRATGVH